MDLPKQKRGSNTVGRIQEALKRTLRNEGIQGLPRLGRRALYKLLLCRREIQRDDAVRLDGEARYQLYLAQSAPTEAERARQAAAVFHHRLSILIPTWNTDPVLLRALADSLLQQTCGQWEACLYDGCSTREETRALLTRLVREDNRFRVELGAENLNISGNTNLAARLATGDWIALCDHDDLLAPDAVYHVLTAAEGGADFVYSDEDKCSAQGDSFFEPHLKPDFSPEALRSGNYICHLMAMEKALFDRVGGLRSCCDGSQDHDLALRATEQARHIVHIPRVLYHWRMVGTSFSHQAAERCAKAAVRAVSDQIARLGLDAQVRMEELQPRMVYAVPKDVTPTLVLWKRDADFARWLRHLLRKTALPVGDVIVISQQPCDLRLRGITVRTAPTPDEAARMAAGSHLVFVAQGLLPESKDWLRELLSLAAQPDVALAGSNILDRKQCYLHAGYAVDVPGGAVRYQAGQCRWGACYQLLDRKLREVTGVSSGLCAIGRDRYLALGGFGGYESDLRGAVLGVKALGAGYRCVITPYAAMRCRGEAPCLIGPAPERDLARMTAEVGAHPAEHYYSPLLERTQGSMTVNTERTRTA